MKKLLNKLFSFPAVIFLGILLAGYLLRSFKLEEFFYYAHDNDLAGWMVKDILVNEHLRLIGQQTSTMGIFIGPLFYYLLIPFYLLTKMDPLGITYFGIITGLFTIWSFYFIFSKLYGSRTGLIASFLYTFSQYMIFNDKEIVPTILVYLWTVWFYYALEAFLKGEKKAYIILGILVSLIWHVNIALVLLLPLALIAVVLSRKKISIKYSLLGILSAIPLSIPLVLFELRHNFSQVKSFMVSLTTSQSQVFTMWERFGRVIELSGKNLKQLVLPGTPEFQKIYLLIFFFALIAYLIYKKVVEKKVGALIFLWLISYMAFFTFYSKVLSEYYLNGMAVVWIAVMAIALGKLISYEGIYKKIGYLILAGYFLVNHLVFANTSITRNGYIDRKDIVKYIDQDRIGMGYPCISISYITEPGYELGYRYFFYLRGMHVNSPISGSPVYTIVFPLSEVDRVDREFGSLGLILPDYKKYSKSEVETSCSGQNSNLTDPMFGYTE